MTDWKMDGKRAVWVTPECSIEDTDLESLVHVHNADIAELQRRLSRVAEILAAVLDPDNAQYGMSDVLRAKLIAEGRDA